MKVATSYGQRKDRRAELADFDNGTKLEKNALKEVIVATTKQNIRGIIPATIFCCDDRGKLSSELLERHLTYLIEAGVDGIFVNGTTGEGAVLSIEEKTEVMRQTARIGDGRVPLYGVCLQPSTDAVVEEIRVMADLGASFASAVPPYYYLPSQEAIMVHFTRIADSSPIPVILYNIPQNTHSPMTVDTVVALSKHPNIVGIKDSSGNFADFNRMLLATDPSEFACVQGEDLLDGASFAIGASGVVTGLGNIRIEHYIEMYRASQRGDRATILGLQKRIYDFAEIVWRLPGKAIPAIKAGAEVVGRGNRRMRVEGLTLTPQEFEKVREVLQAAGVLEHRSLGSTAP